MTRAVAAALALATLNGAVSAVQGVAPAQTNAPRGPCLYWPHSAEESAAQLKSAGIHRICVPPDRADTWKSAGFEATPVQFGARVRLHVPGITAKAELLSATRTPWVDANGWRFIRDPAAEYAYEVPAGKAALAVAEAFAYGVNALLHVDPKDLQVAGSMLAFVAQVPPSDLPNIADFGFVDDGSDIAAEVMKLLVRRNLLFARVDAPASRFKLNVVLGAEGYSREEALDNPSAFARKVRVQLTDAQRSLRVYGTEVVIARLAASATRARLHLLNYGGRELEGLRIRVRGRFREGELRLPAGPSKLADQVVIEGATEFSIPRMTAYALVDLSAGR